MKRIVILGSTSESVPLSCSEFADELANGLQLPRIAANQPALGEQGWIATETDPVELERVLREADTAIWLHYTPLEVLRAAGRRVRGPLALLRTLGLALFAPNIHRLLREPALAHVQFHELRNPRQAAFWLRAQAARNDTSPRLSRAAA
jgi:hypothetical protein